MPSDQPLGVTPPLSVNLPTEAEKRVSDALLEELKRQKTFESPAETQKRHVVLESLQQICTEFVKKVARLKEPRNEVLIRNARGKVFTYGSFRLGVFGPGSDIDTLIVAPKYVLRDDYFEHFPGMLLEMAPAGSITDMVVVTDVFVPIIKFEYSGISIDLIFSRIIQKELVPDFNLQDSNLLRGLDEPELRSLNGTRVTDEILSLVPEQGTFKLALRAIKLWAQRRAIYANIMGFPGGVAWAMLVARVCQLYPKATTSVIVNKFFLVIVKWKWPQPVLLKPIESGPLPVRIWNPKYHKPDSFHLMPVITPAYPSMCATYNITRSSMAIIQRELQRGLELSESIMTGHRQWKDLFERHTFFTTDYKYYISIIATGKSKESHKVWSGFVESKVRMLVQKLEQHPSIAVARPFNKGYERRHICENEQDVESVQEGSLHFVAKPDDVANNGALHAEQGTEHEVDMKVKKEQVIQEHLNDATAMAPLSLSAHSETANVESTEPMADLISNNSNDEVKTAAEQTNSEPTNTPSAYPMAVFTTTHYVGLELAKDSKSLDLSYQVDEFKTLVTSWKKYEDELKSHVSIGVQHVRNINLPDDVFEVGEKRPKKKVGAKGAQNGRKRGHPEDEKPPAKRQQASIAAAG